MDFYLLQKHICKKISKNVSDEYSQKLLDSAKKSGA